MADPIVKTKSIADCEATTIAFHAFPEGAALFGRILRTARPVIAAGAPLLSKAASEITPDQRKAVAAGLLSPLAVIVPAVLADAAPFFEALPEVVAAIALDQQLVIDLLANTTVVADGKLHKLGSKSTIAQAVGYNYPLLVGLIYFAVEVNFAGPLAGAFAGLSTRGRGSPSATATP